MFLKETRPKIGKTIPYSPENSPRKSNATLNENLCSFDEIPLEKNRAMSHKKLSVVSINPRGSGTYTKVQSQKNFENNKQSRALIKQNLQITWKKPETGFENKQKYSLKSPNNYNSQIKSHYPPLNNVMNKPVSSETRISEQLKKIREYFSRQLESQSNTINSLKNKIQQLNFQIQIKNEEIKKLNNFLTIKKDKISEYFLRKIEDLESILRNKNEYIDISQINLNNKIDLIESKILSGAFHQIQVMKIKTNQWILQNQSKICKVEEIQQLRSQKLKQLASKIEIIKSNIVKIEHQNSFAPSTAGSHWEELSDFIPIINNASRIHNFSNMSFADDFFFYPKGVFKNESYFQENFSRVSDDNPDKMTQNLRDILKILQLYDEALPCVIDNQKRIVNMLNSEYLVNKKGKEFQLSNHQLEFLQKQSYLNILKRYDTE